MPMTLLNTIIQIVKFLCFGIHIQEGIIMVSEAFRAYCKDGIGVQNGCNPVAIINSLAKHLNEYEALGYCGWNDLMQDAPFKLWIDKLNDMAGRPNCSEYFKAYETCLNIVNHH